jgi:hypothetical protein
MAFTALLMAVAAHCNKLAEVQYLHSQGCALHRRLLDRAANSSNSEVVRWCYEHGYPWDVRNAPVYAVQSGNVELLAWVLQLPGVRLDRHVMEAAVVKGSVAMCKYLHEQQCPWDV